MNFIKSLFTLLLLLGALHTKGQGMFKTMPHLFTTPKSYVVTYAEQTPAIDGDTSDAAWKQAAWTDAFVDIEGDVKPAPRFNTQLKMLWNNSGLFICVKMQEPHLWAKLTKHDQIIYNDNDFEIFIDPDNNTLEYFEIEVNQLNNLFDLYLPKPYRNGGGALISWDAPGMQSAVKLQGTLNNSNDNDTGWTVEFKIPFSALNTGYAKGTPQEGDLWRINFSRVEWDTQVKNGDYVKLKDAKGKNLPERNWVWSPQGVINMHYPERWGYLQFTRQHNSRSISFKVPYADLQKQYLWLIYYTQQKYYRQNGIYAPTLAALNINRPDLSINGINNVLKLESTRHQFLAIITDLNGEMWAINNDGLIVNDSNLKR